ncbi:MAG: MarR family transcriptional regulator [Alphaproteobacteria bacterium]
MDSIKTQAKRAMNTSGRKASLVIDHLVEALAADPASSLKRALILVHIDENPGITQTEIMKNLDIKSKTTMNREIEWLFNYGCIHRQQDKNDGRAIKLETCGYAKRALESALDYFPNRHKNLQNLLNRYIKILRQARPTLRDARIIATLYEKKKTSKPELMDSLYNGPATTDNRAYKKLIDDGVIRDDG